MERFAFKIDAALKANLYKICRLCGIDNPEKVQIENATDIIDLDEPSLCQKVYELVGFKVSSADKMPQTMCSLCVDKINDFYEFREMCYATNKQTRNLLGLQQLEPEKLENFHPVVKEEPPMPYTGPRRGRKRKVPKEWLRNNLLKAQKLRLQQEDSGYLVPKSEQEIKEEPLDRPNTRNAPKRRKTACTVCGEKFMSKELAERHKSQVHVPSIPRYICNACNQTHHRPRDIRAHQLWHKLSKTPYKCPLCDASLANAYAFTRHVREHTPPTPVQLLVLDRECPLCKTTFVTNYLYNTHRCAIRKRKCGGCSRALNTESAYMRHAPWCAKIYLHHSTHILPEVVNNESQIQIKNEVEEFDLSGLPPATAMPADFVIDDEMQPIVVLERLSSPLLAASTEANRPGPSKNKSSERVSSKKYLKRVDQLLKNTMSTLVSIKHEPEVHINDTGPTEQPDVETDPEEEEARDPPELEDHFMAGNYDSDEEPTTSSNAIGTENYANVSSISVKQELVDEAYEKQLEVKSEPLKLKLKITKNHGKLNSSIIDDLDEAGLASGREHKKKKKRKHKEREKEAPSDTALNVPMVNIKQEPIDRDSASAGLVPEATVMTTIPITQIGNSFASESEQLQESVAHEEMLSENEDVKPNIQELDRLMQISHVVSGVDMAEEAMPLERAVEANENEVATKQSPPRPRSTARKSTAGAVRKPSIPENNSPLPQIVAVEGGDAVTFNMVPDVRIKAEPLYHGYADGEPDDEHTALEEINHNEKLEAENAYSNSMDLGNVPVKQERDLDISDEQTDSHFNGLNKGTDSEDDDGNEDSSADEAEEAMEEEEKRIYREIEMPPLEPQDEIEKAAPSAPNLYDSEASAGIKSDATPVNLVITNICSQAEESFNKPTGAVGSSNLSNESQSLASAERVNPASPDETQEQDVIEATFPETVESHESLENSSVGAASCAVEDRISPPVAEEDPPPSTSSTLHNQGDSGLPAVCESQAVSTPPNEPPERSEKPDRNPRTEAFNAESLPAMSHSSPKDSEAQALPVSTSCVENNYASDEEQQNVLNHELSEQQEQPQPQLEEPIPPANVSGSDEEAENRINEQQQQLELQGPNGEDQRQQRCQEPDDSNINEIAENNNNANIERELQDDALGAQENVNQ
ncbi:uncharacterized protein Dana_GF18590 [Drosophila ananassae]|uniref:C2H2-type domain-containing protein n=1 Tax=Drosophila ananassae TaxID=7217 RepID=B3LVA5_DROAN|nr:histone acetyltransferase KAT6A [Drosophila ananassae]EDV43637.1 uncharacterized protein Dana_GF18590 [Drosophila ananassae]